MKNRKAIRPSLIALSLGLMALVMALVIVLALILMSGPTSLKKAVAIGSQLLQGAGPANPMPAMQGEAATEYLKQQGLYDSLGEAIKAAHYGVYEVPDEQRERAGHFYANNPAQHWQARFTPRGVSLHSTELPRALTSLLQAEKRASGPASTPAFKRDAAIAAALAGGGAKESWESALSLSSVGYGNRQIAVGSGALTGQGNRVEYARSLIAGAGGNPQSTIKEWYVNRAEGLEQGFTLTEPPGQRRAGEPLRLALRVSGELQARVVADGSAVELRGDGVALRYDHLAVQDATGRQLPARMKATKREIVLEVTDEEAVYPLTIDPTFTQQQKLWASRDGIGPATPFGASVGISGDTVVIGAPHTSTLVPSSGVAYVFVRQGENWTLQQGLKSNRNGLTAFYPGFFGQSVGISGDTIVVGAPTAENLQGEAYVFVRQGTTWMLQQRFANPESGAHPQYGRTVGISGETLFISGYFSSGASNPGSVHIFVRTGTVWSRQQRLTSGTTFDDEFGRGVSLSGETLVVGAPLDGDFVAQVQSGVAHVFVREGTVWSLQQKLVPENGMRLDFFGWSVGISGDTIVIGSILKNPHTYMLRDPIYVFVREGTVWSLQQKLQTSDAMVQSGFSAAIVGISGNTIVAGEVFIETLHEPDPAYDSAFVFVREGTVWTQQQILKGDPAADSELNLYYFGAAVAIDGETIVVTDGSEFVPGTEPPFFLKDTGRAYIFARSGTNWELQQKLRGGLGDDVFTPADGFGLGIAISGDTMVVGLPGDNGPGGASQGSAFVFTRAGTSWQQQKILRADDGMADDKFGSSVAIIGNTIVVGSSRDSRQGAVYVFTGAEANWTQQQKLLAGDGAAGDRFGLSVGIGLETIVAGAPGKDAAYVFVRNGTNWQQQQKLDAGGATGVSFGKAVGISGENIVAGASGAVHIFVRNGASWTRQQQIPATQAGADSAFGYAVAISEETLVAGATNSAYVFVRAGTNWTLQQNLSAEGTEVTASNAVAISENLIVLGAPAMGNTGAAYVYVRAGTTWTLAQTLPAAGAKSGSKFGKAVGVNGNTVVVSAPQDVQTVIINVPYLGPVERETGNIGSVYAFVTPGPSLDTVNVARTAGGPSLGSQLGIANDAEQNEQTLMLQVSGDGVNFGGAATRNGVTVTLTDSEPGASGINPNATGQIFAQIIAACGAASADFMLKVTNSSGISKTAGFSVTVYPNTPPVLGYNNQTVTVGSTLAFLPSAGPSDNVAVSSIALQSMTPAAGLTLSVENGTGRVSVTNAAFAGSYTVVVRAGDNCAPGAGSFTDATFTVNVVCPAITLAALPGGVAGGFYDQMLTASPAGGNYTFMQTGGSLPQGLTLNGATGRLSGAPTEVGAFTFEIKTTGFGTCTNTQTLTLVITCPTINLNPASLPNATVNTTYGQTLTATPAVTTYSFAVTGGLLPAGLTLNSNGSFSGAPTQSGVFNFRVTATGFGSCSSFHDYTLLVTCSSVTVNPASLPGGAIGAAYNQTVSAAPAGTYNYSVSSGALPPGLMLNAATGAITGAPSASGSFAFTITASAGSCSGSRGYSVTVGCPAISLPASLPSATAGMTYSQSVAAQPAGAYTYSLMAGSLPSGLMLNPATGAIAGAPMTPGTYNFTVKAQTPNGCSVTQTYSLSVACPAITLSALSTPSLNSPYSQIVTASPSGNYSFAVMGGLPTGLSLNPANGLVSGTPTTAGTYNFTITATGVGSCAGSRAYALTIGGGGCPAMTLADLPNGTPGQMYNHSATASPSGAYNYAVTAGSLPPGLALYGSLGMLFGYPTTAGSYSFNVTATGANNCTGSKQYTLIIGGAALQSLVFGDFDGDGKADLSVWRGQTGEWLTVSSKDGQLKAEAWGTSAAPYSDVMTPGDYDGDGKLDLAVFRRSTGEWLVKRSSDGAVTAKVWGVGTDVPVPGDYDGDGKTDFAIWRGAETNWYILRSSDNQVQTVSWGTSNVPYRDLAVPADYDGDGKTDVAVFRQSNGHWYIKLSSDGSVVDKAWGLGSDVPVAADYDGDGKADIAVWRGADTHWYIVRSSDGATQTVSWGTSSLSDVPVAADYDGDGKADFAIWRASEGVWYVKGSRDGAILTMSQGRRGDAPVTGRH